MFKFIFLSTVLEIRVYMGWVGLILRVFEPNKKFWFEKNTTQSYCRNLITQTSLGWLRLGCWVVSIVILVFIIVFDGKYIYIYTHIYLSLHFLIKSYCRNLITYALLGYKYCHIIFYYSVQW